MSNIDHLHLANDLVDVAQHVPDDESKRYTAQAQVHATLALVEQQRIANLIQVALNPGMNVSSTGIAVALGLEA